MFRTFFSFSGRIGRQTFWLSFLAVLVISMGVIGAVVYQFGMPVIVPGQPPNFSHPYFLATGIVTVLSLWPYFAIYIKRLHDRDMRGWWLALPYLMMMLPIGLILALNPAMMAMMSGGQLPVGGGAPQLPAGGAWMMGLMGGAYLIAMIIFLWLFIVTGFLRGTAGPNRFGPDPLGGSGSAALPQGHDWAN